MKYSKIENFVIKVFLLTIFISPFCKFAFDMLLTTGTAEF